MNAGLYRRWLLVSIAAILPLIPCGAMGAQKPWQEADRSYNTALKVYKLGDWKKAEAALAEFVKKYPDDDQVPVAYLQLADCRRRLKDWKGRDEAIEAVLKKFPDSKAAKYACGYRLAVLRGQKKHDEWLDFLEDIGKRLGRVPLDFNARIDWRKHGDYWWRYGHTAMWFPHVRTSGYSLDIAPGLGWANRILIVADTPGRAIRALSILDKTFAYHGQDLPTGWKFAHIELLRQAEEYKDDPEDKSREAKIIRGLARRRRPKAEEQKTEYLEAWPEGDPRKMGLLLLLAEDAQRKKNESQAGAIHAELMETWPGYSTLGGRFRNRLADLYRKRRYAEYVKAARWYLKHYPIGSWRDEVINWWFIQAREKADKGDASQVDVVLDVLAEEEKGYAANVQRIRDGIKKRLELYVAAKQKENAQAEAGKLLSKECWSKESFEEIKTLAEKHNYLAPYVAKAREEYKIPEEDEKSPAKKQYDELQKRIKDGQTRHMEEIGDEMLKKYPADAWTIKAINDLVDYYYKQVLVEPRDRWVRVMQQHFSRHPLTQDVIDRQIKAMSAAKNYPVQANLLEWAMQYFPGAARWNAWMNERLSCFSAQKEYAEGTQYVQRVFGPRAATGELDAINRIVVWDTVNSEQDYLKVRGDRWRQEAARWSGKPQELYCLKNAFNHFYVTPIQRWWWNRIDFAGASAVAEQIKQITFDPEMPWRMEYESVNILIQSGDVVGAAQKAMETLQNAKASFQISQRLDLYNLGRTLGQGKLSTKANHLLRALMKVCKTPSDQYAFLVGLANMFQAEGDHKQAAQLYQMAAKKVLWPIEQWPIQMQAASGLPPTGYGQTLMSYSRSIRSAQDIMPRLLFYVANQYIKNGPAAKAGPAVNALRKSFPHSGYRGSLENVLRKTKKK
jgi:outer membrane protein assembly factor BamD (BamD/ComL family)